MCNECNESDEKLLLARISIAILTGILGLATSNGILYVLAYILIGYDVIHSAVHNLCRKKYFDEKLLMTIASIGAIAIAEYPEALCLMVLYQLGEFLQDKAIDSSKHSISKLLKIMPDYANIEENGEIKHISPNEIKIGDIIIVKAGEKIPIDGTIIDGNAIVDTSNITGESLSELKKAGDYILSGCINTNGFIKIRAEKLYKNSTVSKIIELVEKAKNKKSKTEKLITEFAKVYTPAVVIVAIFIALIPLFNSSSEYSLWIDRALTFLVISCPCAFVISVPLTFFAGIGRLSKSGILVKGSNYIEKLAKTATIVFDKTGTLTTGHLCIKDINSFIESEDELLRLAAYTEYYSNHPIAKIIRDAYNGEINTNLISDFTEIAGQGVKINLDGEDIYTGTKDLENNKKDKNISVYILKNGKTIGNITFSDDIKNSATSAITSLKKMKIKTAILTGDNSNNAEYIANILGIDEYYSELLPQNKVEKLEEIITRTKGSTIYTGDGINDAPVLTRSDAGIAMGAIGTDAAIEAADIVISDDNLEKIPLAIKISKKTLEIAKENIAFAIIIKALFLLMGAAGVITMWGAVFADVGVTLIAILNSLRTLKVK